MSWELSEPSDAGYSATQKDDSEPEQTQKDLFIKERMQACLGQITKEMPDLIHKSVQSGSYHLEWFQTNVEIAVRASNVSLYVQWWEQW